MKKFLCFSLIAMLFVFSGCNTDKNNNSKTPYKTANSQPSENSLPDKMSDSELLAELDGEYMNSLFFEEFKKSKSMTKADDNQLIIAFRNNSEACSVIVGDGHQGDSLGKLQSIDYADGKYEIYVERDEDNNAKITYTPGSDYLEAKINFYVSHWSTGDETYRFLKYDSENSTEINSILFEGVNDVTLRDGNAYTTINGTSYKISVLTDLHASPINFKKYDGLVELSDKNSNFIEMAYKYDNGRIKLFDMNENFVAELK